jgi:hypothetical protein
VNSKKKERMLFFMMVVICLLYQIAVFGFPGFSFGFVVI